MANLKLLNNVDHPDLKIITRKSDAFGDNVAGSLIFPEEFVAAHKEYPIFIQKDPENGEFQFVALFGFQSKENLFLSESGWQGNYIPALIRREPFFIGFQKDPSNPEKPNPMIHIDLDSPRVSQGEEGERVFKESGGNTSYLESIRDCLMLIHNGFTTSKAMIAMLEQHDLIEQFCLDIVFADGNQLKTETYYTISQEKLNALSDEVVGEWHRKGVLQLIYLFLSSSGNIKLLIDKRNSRLASAT